MSNGGAVVALTLIVIGAMILLSLMGYLDAFTALTAVIVFVGVVIGVTSPPSDLGYRLFWAGNVVSFAIALLVAYYAPPEWELLQRFEAWLAVMLIGAGVTYLVVRHVLKLKLY